MAKVDQELEATLQRIRAGKDASADNPTPLFDQKLHREVVAQSMGGRKPDSYRSVLEFHGFVFHPRVPLATGGFESQWRHRSLRFSFNDQNVVAEFKSPEDLDTWLRTMKAAKLKSTARQ